MEKQTHVHLKDSITTQILKLVFTIYLLVTVTVTLLHMEAEYHKSKEHVVDDLLFFQKAHGPLLRDSLQKEEHESLEKLLFTVLEHPNILGIYLEHAETKEAMGAAGYFQNKKGETLFLGTQGGPIEKNREEFTSLFDHNYLLEYTTQDGRLVPVDVFLYSSDSIILDKVMPGFSFIIANSVIKTLALWIIYLCVSRILLARPLSTLTSAARSISLGNLEHFRIIVNTYGRNELKIMEETFTSMVQNLLTARKKLEESMENLRTIASEGQIISSQRSYSVLAKQVNDSFAKIAHRSVTTELLYSGHVLKTGHPNSFYYVGNEDQSFVEVLPQRIENNRNDQLYFDIEDTKEKICLGQLRFSIPKYDKEHLEKMIPIYRPLFVNIANTIKNISMVKEIQSYAADLENKNSALEEMNKLKETFLANTSHELRTPLNGIIGISESLLDGAEGELLPGQAQNLEMIVQSGKNLSYLIDDLLDFSKMEHHELNLVYSQVDIGGIIEHILGLLWAKAAEKSIDLDNQTLDNIPMVYADESRIHQVLMNLIGNAIKFTHQGKITIKATVDGEFVSISVTDTGIGISEQFLDHIFNPFEQADDALAKEYGGTGLGLAISKQLVELHGGTLKVNSIEELGSVFSFNLPIYQGQSIIEGTVGALRNINRVEETDKNIAATRESDSIVRTGKQRLNRQKFIQPSATTKDLPSSESKQTILVVDDEMINLQVLKNHLKIQGYSVLTAQDSFQAIDLIETESPDLVLLDIMMPKMSGYEACRKIRENHDLYDLPIIMLTARNQIEDLIEGFQCGANDYLTKPFYKEELLIRIQTHLRAKEAVDHLKEVGRLKEQMAQKEQTQEALIASKRRLIRMLDLSDTAIISINKDNQIIFFNQEAEQLFGYRTEDLYGEQIKELIKSENTEEITTLCLEFDTHYKSHHTQQFECKKQSGETFLAEASISQIGLQDEENYAIVFQKLTLNDTSTIQSSHSIQAIEEVLEDVHQFEAKLDGVTEVITEDEEGLRVRNAIVQVMSLTIQYWEKSTQKTKVDLAEESRLWKVYLDKGTFRTRTMDRYLFLTSLPKKPRWRSVISTANFVLHTAPNLEPYRSSLKSAITSLQDSLYQNP